MTVDDRKQRLRRLERIFVRIPIYYVTTCTEARREILASDSIHKTFVGFATEGPGHGAWAGAYVLMPDRLHAFVAIDDQKIQLAAWMKSVKNSLSKTLRLNGIAAPHWQKDFFDHVLRSEESYEEKWHYVRENPVRAELVKNWEDWPYRGEIFDLEFRPEP
jgi:putative transposase